MDVRPNGGRGGGWKRGGRGGNSSDSFGGEHRGRGRGGQHRGRGKRDHYRGRGRGGSGRPADFHHRDRDEGDDFQERDDSMEVFSRRKLESNWDRYTASERREPDDDTPTHRGADYQVLLESAGDSFTQFRFSDEKDWEVDSSAAEQMSAVFVDLAALAQSLQQVPLHQRLNLEAELVQVSTPVQLPTTTLTPKQEIPKAASLTPLSAASKILGTDQTVPMATNPVSVSVSQASSSAVDPPVDDDGDAELDQLLGLQEPVSVHQLISDADEESVVPEEGACEEVKEAVAKVIEQKMEKVIDEDVTSAPARQEMTEEDLEDWLDSMIS